LTRIGLQQLYTHEAITEAENVWSELTKFDVLHHFATAVPTNDAATAATVLASWTPAMDAQLVRLVAETCETLSLPPAALHPAQV
jgi:hypothetical protein